MAKFIRAATGRESTALNTPPRDSGSIRAATHFSGTKKGAVTGSLNHFTLNQQCSKEDSNLHRFPY